MEGFLVDEYTFDNLHSPTFLIPPVQSPSATSPWQPVGSTTLSLSPFTSTQPLGQPPEVYPPVEQQSIDPEALVAAPEAQVEAPQFAPAGPDTAGDMGPPAGKRKKKAPTLSEEAWRPFKDHVVRLYVQEGLPLPKVRETMAREFGFEAETRQYRYWLSRWGLDKKVKTNEMRAIVRRRQRRKLIEVDKKELQFAVRGQEVGEKKIDRFMRDHGISQSFIYSPPSVGPTPAAVDCRTVSSHATPIVNPDTPFTAANSPAVGLGHPSVPASPGLSDLSILHSTNTFMGESPAPISHHFIHAIQAGIHQEWSRDSSFLQEFLSSAEGNAAQPPADSVVGDPHGSRYKQQDEERLREDLLTNKMLRGPGDIATLRTAKDLAEVLVEQGRYRTAEATIRQSLAANPHRHHITDPVILEAWWLLGKILHEQARYSQAKTLLKRIIDANEASTSVDRACIIGVMASLASSCALLGHYTEAEALQRQVIERATAAGCKVAETAEYSCKLADILLDRGLWKAASQVAEEATASSTNELGSAHPTTLKCKATLATVYVQLGKWEEGKFLAGETLEASSKVLGPEHPRTLDATFRLICILEILGNWSQAEGLALWLTETSNKVLGPHHRHTLRYAYRAAWLNYRQSRFAEAASQFRAVWQQQCALLGEEHPDTMHSMDGFSATLFAQSKYQESMKLDERTLAWETKFWGDDHPHRILSLNHLAIHLLSLDVSRAVRFVNEAIELANRVCGENIPISLKLQSTRVQILEEQQRYKEMEELARCVVDRSITARGEDHPDTISTLEDLGDALGELGRVGEAATVFSKCVMLSDKKLGVNHSDSKQRRKKFQFFTGITSVSQ